MPADRPPLPYDPREIRSRLQRELPALLRRLGIDAAPRGETITPLNPTRADRHPGSFVIWTAGERAGAWVDFATDEKGDVFQLVQLLARLPRWIDAYWWALEFLGLARGNFRTADQAQLDRDRARRDAAAAAAKQQADEAGKSERLFGFWLSLPPIAGTLAEIYLTEARGIPLERLAHPPGSLRYAERLEHFDDDTGELTYWPAMVAAMTRGRKVVALHRTYLAPDGRGKADVAKPKKMIGPSRGAAIRLSSGPSGLSPTRAAEQGRADPLAIGEGIETALTVAAARPDYRVWAAGSLSLMGLIDWPECAGAVVLLRDNDWHAEAHKAFDAALAHWRRQANGHPLEVASSALGSDFNDWARAG